MIGPLFVTAKLREYKNMPKTTQIYPKRNSTTPYFFNDDDTSWVPPEDDIYVPNTRFFLDSSSPALRSKTLRTCANPNITNLLIVRMCYVVKRRGFDRKPGKFTFLTHQIAHSWWPASTKHMKHVTPIKEVVAAENFACDASEGRCQHRNAQIGWNVHSIYAHTFRLTLLYLFFKCRLNVILSLPYMTPIILIYLLK